MKWALVATIEALLIFMLTALPTWVEFSITGKVTLSSIILDGIWLLPVVQIFKYHESKRGIYEKK